MIQESPKKKSANAHLAFGIEDGAASAEISQISNYLRVCRVQKFGNSGLSGKFTSVAGFRALPTPEDAGKTPQRAVHTAVEKLGTSCEASCAPDQANASIEPAVMS